MKGILSHMSSWLQLFFLGLFFFGGFVLALLIVSVASGGSVEKINDIDFVRINQIISVACMFLLPAILCAYFFHKRPAAYLKINTAIDPKFLIYSLILIVAIQPLIGFTAYYNNLISLPESLSGLETLLREMEDTANTLTERLLTTDSVAILLLNIFVVAILAGITEEFFFRGSMQQIFKSIVKNRHIAVWLTAFVFSFIHFQFYGFVPRLILGALLGYLFVWSGNLWIPVIVHSLNNLFAILLFHFYHGTPAYEKVSTLGSGDTLWTVGISIVVSGALLFLLSREYIKNNADELLC